MDSSFSRHFLASCVIAFLSSALHGNSGVEKKLFCLVFFFQRQLFLFLLFCMTFSMQSCCPIWRQNEIPPFCIQMGHIALPYSLERENSRPCEFSTLALENLRKQQQLARIALEGNTKEDVALNTVLPVYASVHNE